MVGRAVELTVQKEEPTLGDPALVVEGLTVIDPIGQLVVNDVSFTVRRGEILAVAGVQGNGQTELTEALLGLQPRVQGSINLDGIELSSASVRRILDSGVGFVPEDRTEDGLVGEFTIAENLMLDRSGGAPVRAGGQHPARRPRRLRPREGQGVRRPHAGHRLQGRASSRAATSRRSCSPAS